MAKMAKPSLVNLVPHSVLSMKRNSPQELSDPNNRGMQQDKAVLRPVSGNRGETQTKIQPSTLKCGNRKVLKLRSPGSRNRKVILHTQPAQGNLREVWIHTRIGQKQSFVT